MVTGRGGGEHYPHPPFLFPRRGIMGRGTGYGHTPRFQMAGVGDCDRGPGIGPASAVSNGTMGKGKHMAAVLYCPYCGSMHIHPSGLGDTGVIYICKVCGGRFSVRDRSITDD